MPARFAFTKERILALQPPARGQRVVVHDLKTRGLQLRVTPNGARTFSVFRRMKGGAPERITLGRFPEMTIEQARLAAAVVNAKIEGGGNPAEVKRAHKAEPTFADLFREYLERHARHAKRTWREDEQRFDQYLAQPLGRKRLSAITREDIATVHSAITRAGRPVVANRVLALVSSIYGRGIQFGSVQANPAKGIARNRERSRDRFLQAAELPRFFRALAGEPNETIRDYFLLALLTGARRQNVLSMRWRDIDLDAGEWCIPRTKNDTPQTVTLPPEAVRVLEHRRPSGVAVGYVFPGPGSSGHLMEPKKGWRRLFERDELAQLIERLSAARCAFATAEGESLSQALGRARAIADKHRISREGARIEDLRVHDLRRTLGSWQAKTGASLSIIGKSLNHKSVNTTAIYARLDLDPVRASVTRAADAMFAAGGLERPKVRQRKVRA